MSEQVILVDENDNPIGLEEKIAAHQNGGKLHRAFSVYMFNTRTGKMLLQQRADGKYHAGGLWTNTCCSHPRENETIVQAAARRMEEELGLELPEIYFEKITETEYRADVGGGLTEHEYLHIFSVMTNKKVKPNPDEVKDVRLVSRTELEQELIELPEAYTPWFRIIYEKIKEDIWE